jgi:hypothetical protein
MRASAHKVAHAGRRHGVPGLTVALLVFAAHCVKEGQAHSWFSNCIDDASSNSTEAMHSNCSLTVAPTLAGMRCGAAVCPYDELVVTWHLPVQSDRQWQTGIVVYKEIGDGTDDKEPANRTSGQTPVLPFWASAPEPDDTVDSTPRQHTRSIPVAFIPLQSSREEKESKSARATAKVRPQQVVGCDVDDIACDQPPKLVAVTASEG